VHKGGKYSNETGKCILQSTTVYLAQRCPSFLSIKDWFFWVKI